MSAIPIPLKKEFLLLKQWPLTSPVTGAKVVTGPLIGPRPL